VVAITLYPKNETNFTGKNKVDWRGLVAGPTALSWFGHPEA
jgi:hypothetical protein